MRYNILNRQNGLIWTAEVSFLHKLALMEFALSQVWFLQMEMRIFCASVWGSLTLSRLPLITASLSNGKVGRVNINVRSAERKFEVLFSFVVHCEWLRYLLHLVCLWILSLFPYFSVSVCVVLFFFLLHITHFLSPIFASTHHCSLLLSVTSASRFNSTGCNKVSLAF